MSNTYDPSNPAATNPTVGQWLQGLLRGALPTLQGLAGNAPPKAPPTGPSVAPPPTQPSINLQIPDVSTPQRTPKTGLMPQAAPQTIQLPPTQPLPTVPKMEMPPTPQTVGAPQLPPPLQEPSFAGTRVGAPDYSAARKALEEGRPSPPNYDEMSSGNLSAVLGGLARGAGSVSATEPGSFAKALAMAGAGGSEARAKSIEGGLTRQQEYEKEKRQFAGERAGLERSAAEEKTRAEEFNAQRAFLEEQARSSVREFNARQALTGVEMTEKAKAADTAVNNSHAQLVWKTMFENQQREYESALKEHERMAPRIEKTPNGIMSIDPSTNQATLYDLRSHTQQLEDSRKVYEGLNPGSVGSDLHIMQSIGQMRDSSGQPLPPDVKIGYLKDWVIRSEMARGRLPTIMGNKWNQEYDRISKEMAKDKTYDIMRSTPTTAKAYVDEVNRRTAESLAGEMIKDPSNRWLVNFATYGNPIANWMLGQYQ